MSILFLLLTSCYLKNAARDYKDNKYLQDILTLYRSNDMKTTHISKPFANLVKIPVAYPSFETPQVLQQRRN